MSEIAGTVQVEYRLAAAERVAKTLTRLALKACSITLAAGALAAGNEYMSDVGDVQAMLANTHPYLIETSPQLDRPDSPLGIPGADIKNLMPDELAALREQSHPVTFAMFNIAGFGKVMPYKIENASKPLDALGAQYSVHFDNRGINIATVEKTVEETIDSEGIEAVGFNMNSMGAVTGSEVAARLHQRRPDIKISLLMYDSPAPDQAVLSQKSRDDGYALLAGVQFPGAQDSRYARQAAELYMRWNQVTDLASFLRLNGQVHDEIFSNDDIATGTLMADQFEKIRSARVGDNLKTIAQGPPEDRPLTFFIGAADPRRDDVVNTHRSYALFKKWTAEADLPLQGPYGIKNFYHGEQWKSAPEYRALITQKILPALALRYMENDTENPGDKPGRTDGDGRIVAQAAG